MVQSDDGGLLHRELTDQIIGAAIEVHRELGPGLLESSYEICMCHEMNLRGLSVKRQVEIPVEYKGIKLDASYRLDMLVEDNVIIELKAVERLHATAEAQLLTYLRLLRKPVGLLINFSVSRLKDRIIRRALTQSPLRASAPPRLNQSFLDKDS